MIRITGLHLPLDYDPGMLASIVAEKLQIGLHDIAQVEVEKRTVDTSDKADIHFLMILSVCVTCDENAVLSLSRDKSISRVSPETYVLKKPNRPHHRPIVIGCGPAGMFAALILAEAGFRPILLERGLDADRRKRSVDAFWQNGILDTRSNVQFGEGGAGAFSDGKLKIGKRDSRKNKILNELVEMGAPPEILYAGKPHIGTDRLVETIKSIRRKTESLGGEIHFEATMTGINTSADRVTGVRFVEKGIACELETNHVILAIGHSARDTMERLLAQGIHMEPRPFAVGVRIEHPQSLINNLQYGRFAGHPLLGAADYRMVVHLQNGRGVYTFCMCPGGTVIAATSEEGCVATNGMSEYARNGRNANTALLVTVGKEDMPSAHPLAGIAYQRRMEEAAFLAGGGGYKAPVQRLEDFLAKRRTCAFGDVLPTYLPGTEFGEMDACLPEAVSASLRQGIAEMGLWMPGFAHPDALLTGAETRSSSPVRITRDDNGEALGIRGLYPCGEGSGYSGGILSAAVDGVFCAERILADCDG